MRSQAPALRWTVPAPRVSERVEPALVGRLNSLLSGPLDIDLPGLNGDQVITWLRASELPELRELPILVTTSYPGLMEDEFFLGIKNAGYLMKPFSSSALAAALNKLLLARGSAGKTD